MKRSLCAAVLAGMCALLIWQCGEDEGTNSPITASDIQGTWVGQVQLTNHGVGSQLPDTSLEMSAEFFTNATCTLRVNIMVTPVTVFNPYYKEYSTWTLNGDSISLQRVRCQQINTFTFVFQDVSCSSPTGSVYVNISNGIWQVPVSDLEDYFPPGVNAGGLSGAVIQLTKQ